MSELSPDTKALLARARAVPRLSASHRARLKAATMGQVAVLALVAGTAKAATGSSMAIARILSAFGIGAGLGITVLVAHHELVKPREIVGVGLPSASASRCSPEPLAVRPEVATPAVPEDPQASAPRPLVASTLIVAAAPELPVTVPSAGAVPPASASAEASASVAWVSPSAPSSAVSNGPSLAEEARLIRSAERAIAAGDAASAMRYLDEHARRFPAGALSPERGVQRVIALCLAGNIQQARLEAAPLLRAGGPLRARLRGTCAEL
jgi:hypothetical protein